MAKKPLHFADRLPVWALRIGINYWLPFLGAGITVKTISPDFQLIEVIMKLRWYNKNYVGTQYGGSMYSMVDPFFMLMLIKNLGRDYIIWDKAGQIIYKKPARGTVHARFHFTAEELNQIRQQAEQNEKYVFDRSVDIVDEQGEVVASVTKTLYVKQKNKT
jgi:hypothetical protein